MDNIIVPLLNPHDQISKVKENEDIINELVSISKKYTEYQKNQSSNNELTELIKSKDRIINDLKNEISLLKQKIIDLNIEYNVKIENMRDLHRDELYKLHKSFVKRLNDAKTQID